MSTAGGPVRVCIAQPLPLLRDILARSLAGNEFRIVGACATEDELIDACRSGSVDVAITDAVLADGRAPERAVRELLSRGTRTLVVSTRPLDEVGARLLLNGASGFLFADDAAFTAIAPAVQAVAAGKAALHPDVALAVLSQWRAVTPQTGEPVTVRLTGREQEVLTLLGRGLTTRAISRQMAVAEKTVEAHKSRIYAKLGARNQAHAVSRATELGVLDAER